ncbi:unnamed protein product [Durusdinium trenchii]|uniref:Uncharacterized protein n=1 Tax=Durusdinium trenchii TaxID=1381693 RepID=A0ABP0I807_9DINO
MDVTETTLEDFGYIDSAAGDASGASAVEQVLASRRIADCARDILRRLGEVHGRSEVVLNEHPEELLAKIVTEANEPLQAQRSGGLDLPRAAANARRIWHLLHALEEWYQKEDRTAMILADFHCICESMDNHAELTHGEEVLAARESGMCAKEILRLLGEVPEGPCELNLTGGPNDLLTRMFAEATEPLQAERNGDLNFVDAALNARRILHLSRAVEVWYQNEADEAVQLGRDPLVNFHLVARSESRSAGSGYHTLAVTRESGPGPPLASTAGYDLCDLEVENSEGEPVDALVLAATPSVKLSLLSDKDYIKAICKAAQEKQEMCPACCAPLHAEPSDLSGENRSCERCESQLEVRCYRCLECQWTLCKDCQLPPAKQERIRRWASLVAIPPVVELGGSPLHLAVAEDNFRLAQRFEALINARDRFAQTPLHHAASEGNKQIANWLLDQRADLNAKSKKNITPLYKAVKKGHREVASLFLERGANIAELANCLICSDDSAAMQSLLLLDFSNHVKSCNFNGQTLLHSAAAAGSQLCARALLKHKACSSQEQQKANHSERTKEKEQLASSVFDTNVNIRDQDNRTPLHSTPAFGHDELARTLVKEFDADVNARDKNNRTPLHLAAAKGHTEVVRLLLKEFDADVNASDKDNLTPLYLAVLGGHSDIAMLMLRMAVEKSINSEAGEAKPTFLDCLWRSLVPM